MRWQQRRQIDMSTIQQQIDQMAGKGFSVTNLALNVGGALALANNGKDVFISTNDKENPRELLVSSAQDGLGFAAEYAGLNSVIMYADVKEPSRVMEHPLENGAVVADHQVQMPVEIRLQIVMPYYRYDDIVDELRRLKQTGQLVCVHTKGGVYPNMVFADIPHREAAENVSRLSFDCTLREALLVEGQSSQLAEKDVLHVSNASTVNGGQKKGKEESVLYKNALTPLANLYVKIFG